MSGQQDNEPIVEPPARGNQTSASLQALEQRIHQQELLAELGVVALRGATLDELLDHAVRLTAEGLRTDFCKVLEYVPSAHRFLIRAGVGWGEGVIGKETLGDDLASPAGYALRTKTPVISNHLEREERFRTPEILQRFGIRRAMNVILQGDGLPYGVLEVDSKSEDEFEAPDLAFLQGAANVLGMAIERDRHEARLRAAIVRHRFLLKEMNHRVKNSLAIVSSMLDLQARQIGDARLSEQLGEAVYRVASIAKAHEFLYRESDNECLDLGKYVESVCDDLRVSLPDLGCHVQADYGIRVGSDSAIAAALIVNELVSNAAKYAYDGEPGIIWVRIFRSGDLGFSISVRDEGRGLPGNFDPKHSKGLGMRLVKAFARQLGGKLEVCRRNPGTEIVVTVCDARRLSPADHAAPPPPCALQAGTDQAGIPN